MHDTLEKECHFINFFTFEMSKILEVGFWLLYVVMSRLHMKHTDFIVRVFISNSQQPNANYLHGSVTKKISFHSCPVGKL